jgi:DNA helicase-2/ATP-dependent DNA helicase PcrA
MEDGIFPGMQTITAGDAEMEEERRLAYVAITRAKRELYILHAKNRLLYGSTSYNPISRFVGEIPKSLLHEQHDENEQRFGVPSSAPAWGSRGGARATVGSKGGSLGNDITVGKSFISSAAQAANRAAASAFAAGDRVSHPTFGEGVILSTRPMAADTLLEVAFDRVGTKKLMATYAKLKKI